MSTPPPTYFTVSCQSAANSRLMQSSIFYLMMIEVMIMIIEMVMMMIIEMVMMMIDERCSCRCSVSRLVVAADSIKPKPTKNIYSSQQR